MYSVQNNDWTSDIFRLLLVNVRSKVTVPDSLSGRFRAAGQYVLPFPTLSVCTPGHVHCCNIPSNNRLLPAIYSITIRIEEYLLRTARMCFALLRHLTSALTSSSFDSSSYLLHASRVCGSRSDPHPTSFHNERDVYDHSHLLVSTCILYINVFETKMALIHPPIN